MQVIRWKNLKNWIKNLLILSSSLSTLICCVLPVLLVGLGLGASLVSLMDIFPWLPWLSNFKWQIFLIVGLILLYNGRVIYKQSCDIDKKEECMELSKTNIIIYKVSVVIYLASLLFNIIISFVQ